MTTAVNPGALRERAEGVAKVLGEDAHGPGQGENRARTKAGRRANRAGFRGHPPFSGGA